MCEDCYSDVMSVPEGDLQQYLDGIDVPILVVGGNTRMNMSNSAVEDLVAEERHAIKGQTGGDIFSCVHARLPQGCGNTIHCQGCTIRNCVESTYATGEPHVDVHATLRFIHGASEKDATSLISTVRIRDESNNFVVLLKIRNFNVSD